MGRKTFESLGKPLSGRRNLVLTSRPLPGVETYPTIPRALAALEGSDLVFILGGGQVYAQMLEQADFLYLTIIDRDVEGDTYFPPYEHLIGATFRLINEERHEGFRFTDYVRTPTPPS
jgi:dihydrofolate reductase